MSVQVTVEKTTWTIGGKVFPVTITRRVGTDTYIDGDGKPFLADKATFVDFGKKLGIQRSYTLHPEVEPTEEERARNRAIILEVAAKAATEQNLW